ncbi:thioredoxin [Patescibacteria group bacterium]
MAEAQFTDDNFKDEIKEGVVLVDFFATWCGPCKMLAPVIEELATEYEGKAKIGKLDVDESSAIAGEFGVQSIPTLILFKDGQEVDKMIGFQSKEVLKERLDKALG